MCAEYEERIQRLTQQRDDARKLGTYNDLGLKDTQAQLEAARKLLAKNQIPFDSTAVKVRQPVDVGALQDELADTQVNRQPRPRTQVYSVLCLS